MMIPVLLEITVAPDRGVPFLCNRDQYSFSQWNPLTMRTRKKVWISVLSRVWTLKAWHGCPLRGSTRNWQIQRRKLAANHWIELGGREVLSDGGDREGAEGAQGVCSPMKRTTVSTANSPIPWGSQRLDHQPKNTHGTGHICGRRWPCWTSLGGNGLGPEGVQCPNVGECQGGKMVVCVEEHPHRGKGKGMHRVFLKGRPGNEKTFEM
jgi:hypothetical protein